MRASLALLSLLASPLASQNPPCRFDFVPVGVGAYYVKVDWNGVPATCTEVLVTVQFYVFGEPYLKSYERLVKRDLDDYGETPLLPIPFGSPPVESCIISSATAAFDSEPLQVML